MSNRRKVKAVTPPPIDEDDPTGPTLMLERFKAATLTKPGSPPLVGLRIGGLAFEPPARELLADFVMWPDQARALIAELQEALPD